MRKFLGMGVCQRCGAKEVIAQAGRYRRCSRCNVTLWKEITALQKDNYMTFGSVHGEKRIQNNAK